jgi:hypothetical protein
LLNFNENPVAISATPLLGLMGESAVMSDKEGNLLFYTDGCMVMNRLHQIMNNGDSLNAPGIDFDVSCARDTLGYPLFQGVLALPTPGQEHLYTIFHLYSPLYYSNVLHLLFTTVDMQFENGLGKVTAKNQYLMQGEMTDCLTAVRHGNGRDWWIVTGERNSARYFTFLLSPSGISGPFVQEPDFQYLKINAFSQAVFSPDGTKYARVSAGGSVLIMYFDRCSGRFFQPKVLEPEKANAFGDGGGGGGSFSPDSRYLYISYSTRLYQYDSNSPDKKEEPVLIDEYDGFKDGFPASFYRQMLAPDGKIYMCCTNGIRVMHVINQPNEPGKNCDFRQHSLQLPTPNAIGMNNFPYFRLYDLPHSVCDTLGIDAPEGITPSPGWVPEDGISLQPNPANDFVYIALAPCDQGKLRIYNVAGQLMYEISNWRGPGSIELPVSDWPSGIYFVQLHVYQSEQFVKKLVVMH